MMKNHIRFLSVIVLLLIIQDYSYPSTDKKVLTTDHFIINYTINDGSFAVAVAGRLELYYKKICSFLEFDPLSRINIIIDDDTPSTLSAITGILNHEDFYISAGMNFNDLEKLLYNKLFIIYFHKMSSVSSAITSIDNNFMDALILYQKSGKGYIAILANDLAVNNPDPVIDFDSINNYSKDRQVLIYTVLIDFIISNYGKNVFIQSLRDSGYYDGYLNSISKISGDSKSDLMKRFNDTLNNKRKSSFNAGNRERIRSVKDDFTDISFSVSKNEKIAVLQKNDKNFRIVLKNGENVSSFILSNTESGSSFVSTKFINTNSLAIVEILKYGSVIHLYDPDKNLFTDKKTYHYLSITGINPFDDDTLIFSATAGIENDLYKSDINTGKLQLLTGKHNVFSPLYLNKKIYYIAISEKTGIIEFDPRTLQNRIIYSTDSKIADINYAGDGIIIFTVSTDGSNKMFTIRTATGELREIIINDESCFSPYISSGRIFYFSFYENSYHVVSSTINSSEY